LEFYSFSVSCAVYVGSRMQFVLMDLVANGTTTVCPLWQKYRAGTWRWIALKIIGFFVIFAVIGAILALPLIHLFSSMSTNSGQPPNAVFFSNLFLIFVVIAGAVFWGMLLN
jgi:Na+/phosphate symporter